MARHFLRIVAVFACGLAALAARDQNPPQQPQRPVFRAGAVFVNVDAYPRRDGKVVADLAKSDFEILEDGKPQAVENFEFVRVPLTTADSDRRDPNTVDEANKRAADPHNRLFVVYLDLFHTGWFGSHFSRPVILQFLYRTIGPNDLFGVMTPYLPITSLTFAQRIETLEGELARYYPWGQEQKIMETDTEQKLATCPDASLAGLYQEDITATGLAEMVIRLGNLRDERKNILFISEGWAPRAPIQAGAPTAKHPSIPKIGVTPAGRITTGPTQPHSTDQFWCDSQAARLKNIDFERRYRDLLLAARRANVAFYTVDVAGLRAEPNNRASDTLRTLADETDGGSIFNTNDLTGATLKITEDISAYYLLGYYSTNTAADGNYRRIEVKVKAPGVRVSARRGYMAPTPVERKAELAAAARPVTGPSAVEIELARLARLRSDARAYVTARIETSQDLPSTSLGPGKTPGSIDVIVELASGQIESGQWKNGGDVAITATSKEASATTMSVKGRIEPGVRETVIKVPLEKMSSAGWSVKVRIDGGVDPVDESIEVAPPAASLVSDPIVYRAGVSPRAVLHAVADFMFRRTERLHIEWPVARSLDERTARLLGRGGDPLPVPVTLTERTDGDRIVLAADLTLAPLAAGDYVIEVSAAAGSEKTQKLLAFRVVR